MSDDQIQVARALDGNIWIVVDDVKRLIEMMKTAFTDAAEASPGDPSTLDMMQFGACKVLDAFGETLNRVVEEGLRTGNLDFNEKAIAADLVALQKELRSG